MVKESTEKLDMNKNLFCLVKFWSKLCSFLLELLITILL